MSFTIIYKIQSINTNKCYIGSTSNSLSSRISVHISSYKRWIINPSLSKCSSFEIFEAGDFATEVLETINTNVLNLDDIELQKFIANKEKGWLINFKNNAVNKNIPSRTSIEYYYDNKDSILNSLQSKYKDNVEFQNKLKQRSLNSYYEKKSFNPLSEFKRLSGIRV